MGAAASAQKNFDQFVGSDGKLDLQEFGLMFKNAGQGGAVSQEQVVKLFEAFDRSGDGEVDRGPILTSLWDNLRESGVEIMLVGQAIDHSASPVPSNGP